jgi:hypothetical protein
MQSREVHGRLREAAMDHAVLDSVEREIDDVRDGPCRAWFSPVVTSVTGVSSVSGVTPLKLQSRAA